MVKTPKRSGELKPHRASERSIKVIQHWLRDVPDNFPAPLPRAAKDLLKEVIANRKEDE